MAPSQDARADDPGADDTGAAAGTEPGAGPALADPGQRVLARIVDTLIVGLPTVMVLLETVPRSSLDVWGPPLVAGLLLVSDTVQTALWGCTVGKRVAGIAVVSRAEGTASRAEGTVFHAEGTASRVEGVPGAMGVGWGRSLLRAVTFCVPIALRPVPGLGLLASIFWVVNGAFIFEGVHRRAPEPEGPRLALHDRFAATEVVRVPRRPAPPSGAS